MDYSMARPADLEIAQALEIMMKIKVIATMNGCQNAKLEAVKLLSHFQITS